MRRGAEHNLIGARYQLGRTLGRGGMGAVFEAVDTSTGTTVALKRTMPAAGDTLTAEEELRFRREFHTLASLRHPRVVAAYDYGREARGAFYTMELLDGQDLKRLAPMTPTEACRVLRDIASALAFLHTRGFVHRDLKPRNVRCTDDGTVKLIDFGVMATVGTAAEVAGTPNYAAPETVYGRPVDGRTDLYALGAVGYVLLTGRPPFPARTFGALRDAWRDPLVPPSVYASAVDEGLEELIVELLCLNPLGRPPSAAVVVDRLTALGHLPRAPELALERGYLASAAMVGRRREMAFLRRGLDRAAHGEVALAYVSAPSGAGKSRLTRELSLEAKLAGASVALVGGKTAAGGPYGVVESLLTELVDNHPDVADDAPATGVGTLVRILPRLSRRLGDPTLTDPAGDPGEERMRVQRAIADWVIAAARRRMVVLIVDDVQRVDEASAAALAALARDPDAAGIYLLVAQRTGEPVRAPAPVAYLARRAESVTLAGLNRKDLGELVRSFFGDVPHVGRLARFMHDVTEGSPLLCQELANHLVEAGIVRYVDGAWRVPMEIRREEVPDSLAAAMDHRLESLTGPSRALAEVLAVHGGGMALGTAVALAETTEPAAVFGSLEELVQAGVLGEAEGTFRFRHDQLREALLRGLDPHGRQVLHLRVARQIEAAGATEVREAELGWHYVHGGEKGRGARHLERAGRRLYQTQALSDCLAPLETAHEILRDEGASETRRLDMLFMLLAAGWVSNRDVGYRFAEEAVVAFERHCGIATASRWRRFLGRHVALVLGLAWSAVRWAFRWRGPRGPAPAQAIVSFSLAVGYACGLIYAANRRDEVLAMIRHTEPLNCFRNRLIYTGYLGMQAFPAIIDGRLGRAEAALSRCLDIVADDRLTPSTEEERHFIEAGLRGLRAIIDVNQFEPRLDEDLARMEALEFRYYHLVAQTARVVRHRYRGEETKARAVEREMEAASLQLGSWSTDLQILLFAHPAYALCHDVEGLKRCLEELEAFVDEGFRFETRVTLVQAEIEREGGDAAAAVRRLEGWRPRLEPHDHLMRQWLGSALAEAYLADGRAADAEEEGQAVATAGAHPDHGVLLPRLRVERVLALAAHDRGRTEAALSRLAATVAEAEAIDCPVLAGHLHEAWARIAHDIGDTSSFEIHAAVAGKWLRPTENPYLIAVHERLMRRARGAPSHSGPIDRTSRPSGRTGDEPTVVVSSPGRRGDDSDTETQRH
ncbi:MAG: protein kinase [Myxococcota bacterium]